MPKLKTKKSALKRISITKRGKFKRFRTGTSHLMGHKSSKRRRQIRRSALIASVNRKVIARMLPYGRR